MDRYGHLFLDEKDRLAASLDAAFRGAETDSRRTIDGLPAATANQRQDRDAV